ncbi:5'-methylthioadenosine/S-adenosylhomocysteine nucleosidase [Caulifigura coniformis]|uniref:5'-methylthioadenosine/S-adenosylhomocysteine nucleosidase n=1 Tax=Caulifigura coniformis TaxID=2527983 RepID=A0A517SK06_9PLAN|nr:5'-methylthioadenosine nucleosidase [Caulifigura coniformis]QDT56451.1 5'-methylthioadenosine/S-adenosylhomocysteine nucleosidase [Caulifigura coniformis]
MTLPPPPVPPGPEFDTARADIGIVVALHMEIAPFLDRCEQVHKYTGGPFVFRGGKLGQLRIAVVETGPGASLAARGTRALLDAHRPDWVISVGFSGSIVPTVVLGDLVVATSIRSHDARELKFDVRFEADPDTGLHAGPLFCADHILRTVTEKKLAATKTGCLAVDLESFAVADTCRAAGQKFLAIRGISDDLTADLPAEALAIFAAQGFKRWGVVAGSLFRKPSSVQNLWELRGQAMRAADAMAAFLPQVIPSLPLSSDSSEVGQPRP